MFYLFPMTHFSILISAALFELHQRVMLEAYFVFLTRNL
jgi:hypothetical protein